MEPNNNRKKAIIVVGSPKSGNTFFGKIFRSNGIAVIPIAYRGYLSKEHSQPNKETMEGLINDNVANHSVVYFYSPHGTVILEEIQSRLKELGFDEQYVVHLVRDGRNVVASFLNHNGYSHSAAVNAERWCDFVKLKNKYIKDSLVLNYEYIVEDVQRAVNDLCDFANISKFEVPSGVIKPQNNTWDKLSPSQQKIAMDFPRFKHTLEAEGYL